MFILTEYVAIRQFLRRQVTLFWLLVLLLLLLLLLSFLSLFTVENGSFELDERNGCISDIKKYHTLKYVWGCCDSSQIDTPGRLGLLQLGKVVVCLFLGLWL